MVNAYLAVAGASFVLALASAGCLYWRRWNIRHPAHTHPGLLFTLTTLGCVDKMRFRGTTAWVVIGYPGLLRTSHMFVGPGQDPTPDALPFTLEVVDGQRRPEGTMSAYARVPVPWLSAARAAGEMCELLVPRDHVEDPHELRAAHELACRWPEWSPLIDRRARAALLDRALDALRASRV